MTDDDQPAKVHFEHVLDQGAMLAIPLDVAKAFFATAVAEVSVHSHVLGQEAGRRQAAEEYEEQLAALRAAGREMCETVAGQLRLISRNMTSQPFDGGVEIARLADELDPPEGRT